MIYVKVFTDFAKSLEPLGEAEIGRLFMAMLKYAELGAAPELRGNERFIWPQAKASIDRDRETYERKASIMRENRAPQISQEVTRNHADISQDKDKDKEYTPKPPRGEARFAAFWTAYPRKVGKDAARKAFERRKPDESLLAAMLAAIEQQRESDQWQKNGGQFIPHPATWLNQGRWEDETDDVEREPDFIGGRVLRE